MIFCIFYRFLLYQSNSRMFCNIRSSILSHCVLLRVRYWFWKDALGYYGWTSQCSGLFLVSVLAFDTDLEWRSSSFVDNWRNCVDRYSGCFIRILKRWKVVIHSQWLIVGHVLFVSSKGFFIIKKLTYDVFIASGISLEINSSIFTYHSIFEIESGVGIFDRINWILYFSFIDDLIYQISMRLSDFIHEASSRLSVDCLFLYIGNYYLWA